MKSRSPLLKPELEFLFELVAEVDKPFSLGFTKHGKRQVVNIVGGTFEGPLMRGNVLKGGSDFQTIREDGTADLVANYCIQTDDNQIIYLENTGIRTASPEVLDRLTKGEDVDPSQYYMRTSTNFEVDRESRYHWLNKCVAISTGMRKAKNVIIRFYKVL